MLQTKEAKTMKRWNRSAVLALVPLLMFVAAASATADDEAPLQKIGTILLDVRDPVRQAAGFAAVGLNSYSEGDFRMYAQAAVNLLEGEDSEFYDETILGDLSGMLRVFQEYPTGIRGRIEQLTLSPAEWEALDESATADEVRDGWAYFEAIFRVASAELQEVLWPTACSRNASDHFLIAMSLLHTAQEIVSAMLEQWGFEIRVSPGESIQAAIDVAQAGATITIEPGTYRETLDINKSITLDGWTGTMSRSLGGEHWDWHGAVIQPVNGQVGIYIGSSEEISVEISGISIEDASTGIGLLGASELRLDSSDVFQCDVGLEAAGTSSAAVVDCLFDSNGIGIRTTEHASATFDDCTVRNSSNTLGAVQALETSHVEIMTSYIADNHGIGVVASDQAFLSMADTVVKSNGSDGVLLAGTAQAFMTGMSFMGNDGYGLHTLTGECPLGSPSELPMFAGTIRGSGNYFAPADIAYSANRLGRFCPEDLEFLLVHADD